MAGRNVTLTVGVFAVLAVGALVRIDRLSNVKRDDRFLTLGQLARDLATEKQTFDLVLGRLGASPLVGDAQIAGMRKLFELGDYGGLDAQPQVTLDQLNAGLALLATKRGPPTFPVLPAAVHAPLGIPTGKPAPIGAPSLVDLGLGLTWGDRVDAQKAKRAGDSDRLAEVLDGLALGTLVLDDGTQTPLALMESLTKSGHTVVVLDQRLAANFGDLERKGKPIATPLWVATGLMTKTGQLHLPVPHAQLLIEVRGPTVNADVTLYPALDLAGTGGGGMKFRGDLTGDQPWCGGRVLHRYEGADALKAVEVMAMMRRAVESKVRQKALPLDGYFALGVCTLAPAVVERAVTGKMTVWPLTHDPALFDQDIALDVMVRGLPRDGRGSPPPSAERINASLPWATLAEVPFDHLRAQLAELALSPEGG